MKHEITKELIKAVTPYIIPDNITISTNITNCKSGKYYSDLVTAEQKHRVGFEVFDNEIIVFYFTDHCHFEDYSSNSSDIEDNYIIRAKKFIVELFTLPIRHVETYKCDKLVSEKYYIVHPDGREESKTGVICHSIIRQLNPFIKKTTTMTTWQYDKSKEMFTNSQPKIYNPKAVEVITVDNSCYVEIFESKGLFYYEVWKLYYDDYYGMNYWSVLDDGTKSIFDTKEKAVSTAKEILSQLS